MVDRDDKGKHSMLNNEHRSDDAQGSRISLEMHAITWTENVKHNRAHGDHDADANDAVGSTLGWGADATSYIY